MLMANYLGQWSNVGLESHSMRPSSTALIAKRLSTGMVTIVLPVPVEAIGQSVIIFFAMRFFISVIAVDSHLSSNDRDFYSLDHLLDHPTRVERLETPMLTGDLQTSSCLNGIEEPRLLLI